MDGEATADETKVVEQLLKSDEEAQAYMQGLQEINLELTAFGNNRKSLETSSNGPQNM